MTSDDGKSKSEDGQRGRGVDGDVAFAGDHVDEQARAAIGDGETGESAEDGENHAFGESLAHETAAGRAECGTDGGLRLARGGADEHEVGEVGAGDEQDEGGDPHGEVEAVFEVVLHLLDAAAAGREVERLFGDEAGGAFFDFADGAEKELAQLDLELGFHLLRGWRRALRGR